MVDWPVGLVIVRTVSPSRSCALVHAWCQRCGHSREHVLALPLEGGALALPGDLVGDSAISEPRAVRRSGVKRLAVKRLAVSDRDSRDPAFNALNCKNSARYTDAAQPDAALWYRPCVPG